ncbi:MAG: hypothetical protein Aurels2KO_25680 [Aureliella sp.]
MTKQRFERAFDRIRGQLETNNTQAIVDALEVVAQELSELNVAASKLMDVPDQLSTVIGHLEKIDAQTDETATLARQKTPTRKKARGRKNT